MSALSVQSALSALALTKSAAASPAASNIPVPVFPLITGQRSISGSPIGSPTMIATMLDFAARHKIAPQTEHFPMSRINEAFEHLEAGKARYRIVLDADFKK